jgi:ribonuclease HI
MIVYTDGSCKKNKRIEDISKQPKGGIGVFWEDDNSFNVSESFIIYPVTNMRTELYACIKAIEIFIEHFYNTDCEIESNNYLIIITDSQFTINAMTKWSKNWKKKNWKKADGKPVQNIDLITKLYDLYCSYPISFKHVRSHQKEPVEKDNDEYRHWYGNMMADKLAT